MTGSNQNRRKARRTYICGADLCQPGSDRFEGPVKRAIETGRNRLLVAMALFVIGFAAVGLRLVDLTLFQPRVAERLADETAATRRAGMARADIVDRNGTVLATNLTTASLYAHPREILDADEAAARLVTALPELDAAEVAAVLKSDRQFVWLHRDLTPKQKAAVNRLGIPGLQFQHHERRVYPQGPVTSHVLGYAGVDNQGLAGIEYQFDEWLRRAGERGEAPLQLSLDIRVQHLLHAELAKAVSAQRALGGSGLVLDVETGEVLAMTSLPDFDPNRPGAADAAARRNRNTLGVYEMGSTFKILTVAMALETGAATLEDSYDARQPLHVARYTIRDFHGKNRLLTVPEIFMYSSNIGAARMALDVGTERQRAFLARLGMFDKPAIELREIGIPLQPENWREINTMTVAFGHGVAVSPLQLAVGVGAIVNGGILRQPTLLKRRLDTHNTGNRVLSRRTSQQMRELMRRVVQEGTGRQAKAAGFDVGGKTGTAEKLIDGRYDGHRLLSSFVGVFPIHQPRYLVLVTLDEPKGVDGNPRRATGGWVAAPVVGAFIGRAALMLGVKPVDDAGESGGQDDGGTTAPPLPLIKVSGGG